MENGSGIEETISFSFCKTYENVPFFEHMHSKFEKNGNMTPKTFVSIKSRRGIANFMKIPNLLKRAQKNATVFSKKTMLI
jgi:hypothetical protein